MTYFKKFKLNFLILLFIQLLSLVYAQYNFCLMPPGCKGDECCYPVVMNFDQKCFKIPACSKPFMGDCCYNSRVVKLNHGYVYGFAQLLDDSYGYRDSGKRYLQMFLGVRYAQAPVDELRFKKPEPLDISQEKIDAMKYGDSCPQHKRYLRNLMNPSMSEDCLNMNIYVLNDTRTEQTRKKKYPIFVFFHGGQHKFGSANLYPGHILAQQGIMVVTVNYRLGPLGFLSTEDENARGNYGLWDQLAALQFIKDYGDLFQGDITKVTLVGHETGAADVALHMMRLQQPYLFHRAMWLSGSDLMAGGFVQRVGEAKRFAEELGVQVGCSKTDTKDLVDCLSNADVDDLVNAGDIVKVHGDHWNSIAWSPCIDGEFITDFPKNLRQKGKFRPMRVIGGLPEAAGTQIIQKKYPHVLQANGLNHTEFRRLLRMMVMEDDSKDIDGSVNDIAFEYAYWPDLGNDTWRLRKFVQLWTDRSIGAGLDSSLKFQSDRLPLRNWTQMFVLRYVGAEDRLGQILGTAYYGTDVSMIFGLPYINSTSLWENLGLRWQAGRSIQDSTTFIPTERLDINMTDYMIYFVTNFVISGNATPNLIRNLTWDTYRPNNRTYFLLDLHNEFENDFELYQDYHVWQYAIWQHYYNVLLQRLPRFSTPFPTPAYLQHLKMSSFTLGGLFAISLLLLFILLIVLIRKKRQLT